MTKRTLKIQFSSKFKKDIKKVKKSGKNIQKLLDIIDLIINEKPLPENCYPHPLIGKYKNWLDCHIESDWILIYKITDNQLKLSRTGSHSDLFF